MRFSISESAQRSLIKKYHRQGKEVLYKTSLPVLQLADKVSPQELKQRIPSLLKPDLMNKYILDLWSKVGGKFASDTVRMLKPLRKSLEDPELESWEGGFKAYMAERSKKITKQILTTQAETLNTIIDKLVAEAYQAGDAISTISGRLKDQFDREMVTIQRYEAERIARTEVIGASNKGSFDGAKSTGLPIQKGWSTSGLSGIRDSHLQYEGMGWLSMDTFFAGAGFKPLLYPGDPNGDPGDTINCRCSIIYNVD